MWEARLDRPWLGASLSGLGLVREHMFQEELPVSGSSTLRSRKPTRTSGTTAVPDARLAQRALPDLDGNGAWVIMPTYNEAENLPGIALAVLEALPRATLLVVDDGSPDGTGQLADRLAASDSRLVVRHRAVKQGLGKAYLDGFDVALESGALVVIQMDADWSHDPTALPALLAPIARGDADLVIGSRYVRDGGVENWPLMRRIVSRSGSMFARALLRLEPLDLTGGFKAWRAATLRALPFEGVHAGGYVFQIEMTYRAKAIGARVQEVPITFRDRTAGTSKMSNAIILEALIVVLRLRLESLQIPGRNRRDR